MASLIRRKRTRTAEVEFALDLGEGAVVLYERGAYSGWKKFASAELDDPEFSVVIGLLRSEAETYSGARDPVRLWLPSSQVLKRRAEISGRTQAERLRSAYDFIRLQTAYRAEDVAIAVAPQPRDGKTTILITFAETWREARIYAERWGFVPGDVSTRCFAADFGADGPVFLLEDYEEERPATLKRAHLHMAAAVVAIAVTGAAAWALHPQLTSLIDSATGEDGILARTMPEPGGEANIEGAEESETPDAQDTATGTTFTVTAQDASSATNPIEPEEVATQPAGQEPVQAQSAAPGAEDANAAPELRSFELAAPAHVPSVPSLSSETATGAAPQIHGGPAKLATLAAPADLGEFREPGGLPARPPIVIAPSRASSQASAWRDVPGLESPDQGLPQLASLDLAKGGSSEILRNTDLDLLGSTGALGQLPQAVPRSLPADVKTQAPASLGATGDDVAPLIAPEVREKLDDVLTVTQPPVELASVAPLAEGLAAHPDITPSAVADAPLPFPKPTADLAEPALAPAPSTPVVRIETGDADLILAQAPDTVSVLPAPKPPVAPGPETPVSTIPELPPDPNDLTPTALAAAEAPMPPRRPWPDPSATAAVQPTEDEAPSVAKSVDAAPADAEAELKGALAASADAEAADLADADGAGAGASAEMGEEDLTPTALAAASAPLPPLKPWDAAANEPAIAAAPNPVVEAPVPGASDALATVSDPAPAASAPPGPEAQSAETAGAVALADLPEIDHPTANMEPTALAVETGPLPAPKPVTEIASAPVAEEVADAPAPDAPADGAGEIAPTDAESPDTTAAETASMPTDAAVESAAEAEPEAEYPVTVIPDLATAKAELRVPAPRPQGVFRAADGSIRSLAQMPPRPRPAGLGQQDSAAEPEPAAVESLAAVSAIAVPETATGETATAKTATAETAPADGSSVPVTVVGTDPLRGLLPDQETPQAEEDPDAPTQYASLSAPLPRTRPALPTLPKTLPSIALPKISPQSVQQAATEQGLPLDRVTLIGILDLESGRRALLRLPNGRYRSVVLGDVLDGWRVSLIGRDAMRVTRSGEDRTLLLVSR